MKMATMAYGIFTRVCLGLFALALMAPRAGANQQAPSNPVDQAKVEAAIQRAFRTPLERIIRRGELAEKRGAGLKATEGPLSAVGGNSETLETRRFGMPQSLGSRAHWNLVEIAPGFGGLPALQGQSEPRSSRGAGEGSRGS